MSFYTFQIRPLRPDNGPTHGNMTASQTDMDALPTPLTPAPARRTLVPRPNCTHIVMDYFYTKDIPCDSCHRPSNMGFLYVCRQDVHSEAIARRQMEAMNDIYEQDQLPSRIDEFKAYGVSQSVIDQIKQGNVFDPFHIEVLKNQKVNLLQIMDQQLSKEHEPWNVPISQDDGPSKTQPSGDATIQRNITMRTGARTARAATSKLIQKLGHYRKWSQIIPKCGFKCCHACRPYLKDRAFISLDSALFDTLDHERFVPQERPIANVSLAENLGLRPTPQPRFFTKQDSSEDDSSSSCSISSDEDENDYNTSLHTTPEQLSLQKSFWVNVANTSAAPTTPPGLPPPASYTERLRERAVPPGFGKAIRSRSAERNLREAANVANTNQQQPHGLLRRITRSIAPSPIPSSSSRTATNEMLALSSLNRTTSYHNPGGDGNSVEEDVENADLGLQSATTSTPKKENTDSFINRGLGHKESSGQASPLSSHSDVSTSSEEVQVEGGVAVTEEAVETHIPDIITQC